MVRLKIIKINTNAISDSYFAFIDNNSDVLLLSDSFSFTCKVFLNVKIKNE